MRKAHAPGDTNTPNQKQSRPGQQYTLYPESKYLDLTVPMFADVILDLDYEYLNYCYHTDPDWIYDTLRFWEVQKALSVITPSARTYRDFKKSTDLYLVWGVLANAQIRAPNMILERHLAAVMPVFTEQGLRMYQEKRAEGELDPQQYHKPLFTLPHLRNQVSHFFHCIWGYELDEYLPSMYQMHTALWDIQPDAMRHFYSDIEIRPPHESVVAELKAVALRAQTRGELLASGQGLISE